VSLVSKQNDTTIELQITGDMEPLIKALGDYPIVDIQTARPSLEDIFMAYYEAGGKEAD
jgi:ABC-2 type transport system ATP-binding protein